MLYPLSYGGSYFTEKRVSYPRFCRVRHLSQTPAGLAPKTWSPARPRLKGVTHLFRPRCDGTEQSQTNSEENVCLPSPPALLPWLPRLRTIVTDSYPRLSGELSPLSQLAKAVLRQVYSLLRLLSWVLANDMPPLTVSRGPHLYGSRDSSSKELRRSPVP